MNPKLWLYTSVNYALVKVTCDDPTLRSSFVIYRKYYWVIIVNDMFVLRNILVKSSFQFFTVIDDCKCIFHVHSAILVSSMVHLTGANAMPRV